MVAFPHFPAKDVGTARAVSTIQAVTCIVRSGTDPFPGEIYMSGQLYVQLSLMMFLQFAVWGAWSPVLASRLLGPLKMSGKQTGWIYGTIYIGCIISPLIAGQVADRWVATQYFLAAAHLAGGVLLLASARQRHFTGALLPHPAPYAAGDVLPFLKALGLLSNPNFLVFLIVAFLLATQLQFFFLGTAPYLSELGVPGRSIPAVMTLAQVAQLAATARSTGRTSPVGNWASRPLAARFTPRG